MISIFQNKHWKLIDKWQNTCIKLRVAVHCRHVYRQGRLLELLFRGTRRHSEDHTLLAYQGKIVAVYVPSINCDSLRAVSRQKSTFLQLGDLHLQFVVTKNDATKSRRHRNIWSTDRNLPINRAQLRQNEELSVVRFSTIRRIGSDIRRTIGISGIER